MIFAIVRTAAYGLRRDRAALLLSFVLPVAFFSIFAVVFGSQAEQGTPRVPVVIVDEDRSDASGRLVAGLEAETALEATSARKDGKGGAPVPLDRQSAEAAVRNGDVPVALIIPKGFGATKVAFGPAGSRPTILMLNDSSNAVAPQIVAGVLQKAAMSSMPDLMAEAGVRDMMAAAGGLTPAQQQGIDAQIGRLRELSRRPSSSPGGRGGAADGGPITIAARDIVGENKKSPIISFYAAGIGVMFMLFTASGAGGVLLDEAESGALDRVLASQVSLPVLLLGKLAYLVILGTCQLIVMFAWGALVFRLDLFAHIPGFLVMTFVTALASSALGLLLASACHTRAQLGAVSTLVILTMSALGGSMFPRFLMPASIQKVGLVTFNAWALDGFIKVFWRDAPLVNLWPQVGVLLLAAAVFFSMARRLARRWEHL